MSIPPISQLPTIDLVAGDDINWACTYTDDSGAAIDLTGYTIKSQLRDDKGALLADLEATVTDAAAGEFELTLPYADTESFPDGVAMLDIRYTVGAQRRHTSKARVRVSKPVTFDEA